MTASSPAVPDTATFDLTVTAAQIGGASPPRGGVGEPYSCASEVGGDPAPTVSVSSRALPPGLSLSGDGLLSGTPSRWARTRYR